MSTLLDIYKDFSFLEDTSIMQGKVPIELNNNLIDLANKYKKIKEHSLSCLRYHKNTEGNSYQISITKQDLHDSFLFGFLINLGEYYIHKFTKEPLEKLHRRVVLREHTNHYDEVDVWLNYSYKQSKLDWHAHSGSLSGVIYIVNPDNIETTFKKTSFAGSLGDIVIFNSNEQHKVKENKTDNERVTIAFNLNYLGLR